MPDFSLEPTPHAEAMAIIAGKPVVSRAVFDQMLPEIRGRVFTITGIEGTHILERARSAIAGLPEGKTWNEAKENLLAEISPFFNSESAASAESADGPSPAEQRAEFLLRTNGFQAFNAANWRTAQEDEDTTHLQYLATEDSHVRDTHLALNGIILPKDDPFWDTHTPPWEFGCRCRIRAINPDLLDDARAEDEDRAPDAKLVIEGPQLQRLRDGMILRDGQAYDTTPPRDSGRENAYQWHPDDLRLPVSELEARYSPEEFAAFKSYAQNTTITTAEGEMNLWEWLQPKKKTPAN